MASLADLVSRSLTALSVVAAVVHGGCTISASTCYDDSYHQTFGPYLFHGAITLEWCAQVCADKGTGTGTGTGTGKDRFTMAGAGGTNGNECFCGTAIDPAIAKSKQCNAPCSGNRTQTCGGSFLIDTFTFSCSGAPVPEPPQPPPPPPPPKPCTGPFNSPPGSACPSELFNPCIVPGSPQRAMPFCNVTVALAARAADAVSRMTLAEKICNLGTTGCPIKALDLPAYNWWNEASTGVATDRWTETTKFAFPITTAMSYNRTLWRATGNTIGREARALMNAGNAYSTFWAPVINLAREPRWGRNIETPGEDPYLTGEYAESFTVGMQEAPEDPTHLQASACCKHYVANSMESTTEKDGEFHDRNHVDSAVTQRDLVDSYMRPFQSCVEKGWVTSLMCSYNAVNGVPSCANTWLLDTIARAEWGFDGYITSDCDADDDVVNAHHWLNHTAAQGVADVLHAGTDVDCGGFVSHNAQEALDARLITSSDVDARLINLFKVRLRLGHFGRSGPTRSARRRTLPRPWTA